MAYTTVRSCIDLYDTAAGGRHDVIFGLVLSIFAAAYSIRAPSSELNTLISRASANCY